MNIMIGFSIWTLSTDKTDTTYSTIVSTLPRYRVLGCARDSCNSTLLQLFHGVTAHVVMFRSGLFTYCVLVLIVPHRNSQQSNFDNLG